MSNAATSPFHYWLSMQAMSETAMASADPLRYGQRMRSERLASLLKATLAGSPFYRHRARAAGGASPRLCDLAPVTKRELMHNFDTWATDRRITRESVDAFLREPQRVADAYLDRYLVWTSSGTSGEPGIFVQDPFSLGVYDALDALRLRAGKGTSLANWRAGQRVAYVGATGGHFAGNASISRLQRIVPAWMRPFAPAVQIFSVLDPLRQLVDELQAYQPTVLITYPSCAAALAQEQTAGRLRLRLAETWCGGEQLSASQHQQIHAGFGGVVRNNYGASEFFAIAWACPQQQLHLNDDWVILEPVDERGRLVPPGTPSHSVLLTHLANQVQPLLRYDLGDRVRFVGQACACGSAFPVIEVEGRADDTVQLNDARGSLSRCCRWRWPRPSKRVRRWRVSRYCARRLTRWSCASNRRCRNRSGRSFARPRHCKCFWHTMACALCALNTDGRHRCARPEAANSVGCSRCRRLPACHVDAELSGHCAV